MPTLNLSKPLRSHCLRGHLRDVANLYLDPRGKRQCRRCRRELKRAARLR